MGCANVLTFIFNVVNFVSMIALTVGLGFWCHYHHDWWRLLRNLSYNDTYFSSIYNGSFTPYADQYSSTVKIVLCVVLLFYLFVITGITLTYRKTKAAVGIFGVIFIIIGIMSAVTLGIYCSPDSISRANRTDLVNAYQRVVRLNFNVSQANEYGTFSNWWLKMQSAMHCCGVWNSSDMLPPLGSMYGNIQNANPGGMLSSNVLSQQGSLPPSCCANGQAGSCTPQTALPPCGWYLSYIDPVFRHRYIPMLAALVFVSLFQGILAILVFKHHELGCAKKQT
ncbi:hypothetical protein Ciccas_011790 [Cichlidogyrus casuarinus]|uniref:Tetraspanin n=1 Tax=Cichlidogyrus casuarinus TaxID=1844966 RepID=A0ABD2PQ81_9PLAT